MANGWTCMNFFIKIKLMDRNKPLMHLEFIKEL